MLITTFKKISGRHYDPIGKFSHSYILTCFLRHYFCGDMMVLLAPLQPDHLLPILTLCTCAFYSQCTCYWT